jgi:hypothetical protein
MNKFEGILSSVNEQKLLPSSSTGEKNIMSSNDRLYVPGRGMTEVPECIEQLKSDNMKAALISIQEEIKNADMMDDTRRGFSLLSNLTLDCLNLQRYMIDKSIEHEKMLFSCVKTLGKLSKMIEELKEYIEQLKGDIGIEDVDKIVDEFLKEDQMRCNEKPKKDDD